MSELKVDRASELSIEGLAALGAINACDRESISLSGAVQPHGFLIAVDPISLVVAAASVNVSSLVGRGVEPLGVALGDLLGQDVAAAILEMHPTHNPHDGLAVRVDLRTAAASGEQSFDMVAHRSGPLLVLEFEPGGESDSALIARYFRDAMKALLTVDGVEEICRLTVEEVRRLTGYDRVMIYRFEPDAHGHVIAEACMPDAEPFLGLHYPASDIPRQARALYLRNWIRVIADVGYDPVPIAAIAGIPADELDLSMSVLRSVSPLHLRYLTNMGVAATLTISLIVDNQLWGMIACHHRAPKLVDHVQRLACEAIGQLVSTRLRSAESTVYYEHVRHLGQMVAQVVTAMAAGENPALGAATAAEPLLGMASADGAVVEIEGIRVTVGEVPDAEVLDLLVLRLAALAGARVAPIVTEAVARLVGLPAELDAAKATGALYLPLPGRAQGFVLWLRAEQARTVRWAGRADLKLDDVDGKGEVVALTPRASFEEWQETVRGRSLPWGAAEITSAAELAADMPEVLLHRAQNRLVRLALHDPLTGLPNRVLLNDRLEELLTRKPVASASHLRLAVLFIDIDGFKAVNDTGGHMMGDELLTLVGQRITAILRPQDTVARVGGDEFVVLLPGSDPQEATSIGQRIVEDFRRSFVLGGQASPSFTLSVGVTIVPAGAEPGEALRQADAAMYHAKRSGRNRVAVYDLASGTATSCEELANKSSAR